MFKFSFSHEDSEEKESVLEISENKGNDWLKCEEIKPEDINDAECLKVNSLKCGDIVIKHVSSEDILNILKNRDKSADLLLSAEQSHSDLITAVYEGGLKVWECTYDLLNFLSDNNIDLMNKSALDLGCGAGIIGIYSCLQGTSVTYFQDYNSDVIKYVTGLNVKLNNIGLEKCRFYGGDWESFLDLLKQSENKNKKFDYIFTSETIYNIENYNKLLNIFAHLLKQDGIMYPLSKIYYLTLLSIIFLTETSYLAAKYYYFGVGGGIAQFEDMLEKDNIFNYTTSWTCSEGVKRAIIKITLK